MSEIQKISQKLNRIEMRITKQHYRLKSLNEELKDLRKKILNAAGSASKKKLDNLLMYINFLKTKFKSRLF